MEKKIHRDIDAGAGRGIYIHVPFCRQACRYCDFYFTVSLRYMDHFVECVTGEIGERHYEMPTDHGVTSIYLGGGTPSLLQPGDLDRIMERVFADYPVEENPEITIECNPDDLTPERLQYYRDKGFNRLSIGVQSFHDRDLELLRRSHDSNQAMRSIRDAARVGFDNLNIDLIYGLPGQTEKEWKENVDRIKDLPVRHLSAYHLTFEPGTVFDHWRKKGRLVPVHDRLSESLFGILRDSMEMQGFDHYEISNFASGDSHSRHNLVYWSGAVYQGFGPSAHSYDGKRRSWNVPSLKKYMEGITGGIPFRDSEQLTRQEAYHDYLITSLRTRLGVDPGYIRERFGDSIGSHFQRRAEMLLPARLMENREDRMIIPPGKWLVTDLILRELFLEPI